MLHLILVLATRNCGFSERAENPHNLCSCSKYTVPLLWTSYVTSDWIVLNLTHFTSSPPENMRNKTDQALVEWPKGHSHRYTSAIQIRKQNIDSPSVLTYWVSMKSGIYASKSFQQQVNILIKLYTYVCMYVCMYVYAKLYRDLQSCERTFFRNTSRAVY